jgi:hypothetical protein
VNGSFADVQYFGDLSNRQIVKVAQDNHQAVAFIQFVQFIPDGCLLFILDDDLFRGSLFLRLQPEQGGGRGFELRQESALS